MNPIVIKECTLVGKLSGETIVLNVEDVVSLLRMYYEEEKKRPLDQALRIARFHDKLKKVFDAEELAGKKIIEEQAIKEETADLNAQGDMI